MTSRANTDASLTARVVRTFDFVRHIPVGKLARRVELDFRRRWRDRWPRAMQASLATLPDQDKSTPASARPAPVFAPRTELEPVRTGSGWAFTFLNRRVAMVGPGIDWSAPTLGAADQLWRMNLHYMEYLEGLDDERWSAAVRDWIASNPAERPGCWRDGWNSFALSLRVVVWLQELVRRDGRLSADLVALVESSAVRQLRFLERNLETDLGGNHLVKNIKALIWASACFSGADAERWRRIGLRLLDRELDVQILPDGMHYERSASYHAQVLADLIECRAALRADPFGGRLDRTIANMAQALADMTHPDGRVALFNDAGRNVAYAPAACLEAVDRLLGRRPDAKSVFALPAAGYFGARTPGSYVIVDCGRIAPDDLPAHGHADVLSFEWSVGGRRIVVDQGVFEYIAGARRKTSQGAASHNTLFLDGADQAEFFGSFRCGRRPNVEVRAYEAKSAGFMLEGAHDGYRHLPGRPVHVRRIEVEPGRIVLRDTLEESTDRAAAIGFLLHPDCRVDLTGGNARVTNGPVRIVARSSGRIEIAPAVWWPDMGLEQPTQRIVIRMTDRSAPLDTEFVVEAPADARPADTQVSAGVTAS
jgi:uncharacterized heparinase superfamily protein